MVAYVHASVVEAQIPRRCLVALNRRVASVNRTGVGIGGLIEVIAFVNIGIRRIARIKTGIVLASLVASAIALPAVGGGQRPRELENVQTLPVGKIDRVAVGENAGPIRANPHRV